MLMTAVFKDNGLFIPNIDRDFWQNQADLDGLVKLDISPISKNQPNHLAVEKNSHAGILSQYANPELIPLEEKAVEMAIMEKYSAD